MRALSADGALAATLVGGAVLGFGGPAWAALLVLFFASSSALSFFRASDPRKRRATEASGKGGRRDAAQVLANGGVVALLALVYPHARADADTPLAFALFSACTGALAAATADTWATEVGVLSDAPPRMITTGRPVEAGTSGAVTGMGSIAAVAGALFIGLCAAVLSLPGLPVPAPAASVGHAPALSQALAGLAGGVAGALADSLLGATLQASYMCPRCNRITERAVHGCGTATRLERGLPFINNDTVNLLATVIGAVAGCAVGLALQALPPLSVI